MKSWIHFFSPARNIDSLIAGALGFFIIHTYTRHGGIGISPDSVSYLSVARNLHAGKGLIQFDQMPIIEFPAFYPIFLSTIFFLSRVEPMVFAPLMNGLLFMGLIYVSGAIMNEFSFQSKRYKRILLSCLVLSPCLLEVYSMLWSETFFLIWVLLFIAAMWHYCRHQTMRALLLVGIITALACVTRYAGVCLIGAAGIILIVDRSLRTVQKIFRLLVFCAVSYSLLALNLARNLSLSGTFTGMRQKGTTPLFRNIFYYGSTVTDWLSFIKGNHTTSVIASLLILLGFLLASAIFVLRRRSYWSCEDIATLFVMIYSGFLILSATLTRFQQLDSRLLSPIFIPLLWSLSAWLPSRISQQSKYKRPILTALGISALLCFQYNQLKADFETYDGVKDAGIPGYTEDPWKQAATVQFIQQDKSIFLRGYTLYSNGGDAVYFATGLFCDMLPQKVFPKEVKEFYQEDHLYLIWFNDIENPDILSLNDILKNKKMQCIRQLEDGALYLGP